MLASGPLIWSETRQELCESLPYYRAYQTGSYVTGTFGRPPSKIERKHLSKHATLKDSIPYGYLLAGWPSRRDTWAHNGRVVVSHGGGKSEVIGREGDGDVKKASLKQDQSASDNIIRALLHSARHRLPIVLIAADNYALLSFKLTCSYAVLGWYLITDCWAERETNEGDTGFVRWKFRFEWIPAQGQPWWELPGGSLKQGWDPRQRTETFTKSQRRLAKQLRFKTTKKGTSPTSSSTSSASSSSSSLPSRTATPEPMDDDERQRLLFGPIHITAELISTVNATAEAETPCNVNNAASCLVCRLASPIVFDLGWLCLQPECRRFFVLPCGDRPKEDKLNFSTNFLLPQGAALDNSFAGGKPPFSLIPSRPSSRSMDQGRGLWCKRCGRLSCRELIYQPRCAHCSHPVGKWKPLPTFPPPTLTCDPFDFASASDGRSTGIFDPLISASSKISMTVRKDDGLAMYSFTFPAIFGDCCVHLIQADIEGGARELAADQIFKEFQEHAWPANSEVAMDERAKKRRKLEQPRPSDKSDGATTSRKLNDNNGNLNSVIDDHAALEAERPHERLSVIPFRRHVLKSHGGGSGRMLTQQFTCNYGVPYKHVVAMGTEPLSASSSPAVILSTLDLLNSRTASILPDCHNETFNELYPVLYLEHQKMSFHDDGEPGLGPVVSSLSLGSTCRMKFRLKAKHQGSFPDLKQKDRVVLDLPLRHGSVVVQQGHDLQKYFEHCVIPDGFRIAVTARRINPLKNENSTGRGKHNGGSSPSGGIGQGKTNSTPAPATEECIKSKATLPAPKAPRKSAQRGAASKSTGNPSKALRSNIKKAGRNLSVAPAATVARVDEPSSSDALTTIQDSKLEKGPSATSCGSTQHFRADKVHAEVTASLKSSDNKGGGIASWEIKRTSSSARASQQQIAFWKEARARSRTT